MDFVQSVHAKAILDCSEEYKLLGGLASDLAGGKDILHRLSDVAIKLVGKNHAFLLDPPVHWTIAANRVIGNVDFFWRLGDAVKKEKKISPHKALKKRRLEFVIRTQLEELSKKRSLLPPRKLKTLCDRERLWKGDQSSDASFRKWLTRNRTYIRKGIGGVVDVFEDTKGKLFLVHQRTVGSPPLLSPQRKQEWLEASVRVALKKIQPFLKALPSNRPSKKEAVKK